MIRLIISEPRPTNTTTTYAYRLDGDLVCRSDQGLYDGARVLLDRGYSPGTMLTARHVGADHDSWVPHPIGELAKWTIWEDGCAGRRAPFRKRGKA